MNRAAQKLKIKVMLEAFMKEMRSADLEGFTTRESRYGFWCESNLIVVHSETGKPAGIAKFQVYFPWDEPLINFRLVFCGPTSQYLNRRHALKDCLVERAYTALGDVYADYKNTPHIYEVIYG